VAFAGEYPLFCTHTGDRYSETTVHIGLDFACLGSAPGPRPDSIADDNRRTARRGRRVRGRFGGIEKVA